MVEEIKDRLETSLTPKRFIHSINVMNTAVKIALKHGEDDKKAATAGLLHDYARDIRGADILRLCEKYDIAVDNITRMQPELLHGPVGAYLVREEFGITDEVILNAISYHTTGRENMSTMEKIIFVSDYVEPDRVFPGVDDIRKIAFYDLEKALVMSFDSTIKFILKKGALIHPDSVKARNYILAGKRMQLYNNI